MRKELYLWFLGLGVSALVIGGCNSLSSDNTGDGGGNNKTDGGALPSGLVSYKNAGETTELTLDTTNQYLVVPYSVSEQSAEAIAFDVKVTGGQAKSDSLPSTKRFSLHTRKSLKETHPVLWTRWQQRLTVEAWTRGLAEKAAKARLVPGPGGLTTRLAGGSCALSSECGATEVCQAGTCASSVTIKTGSFSDSSSITTTVQKKGKVAAVLVDSEATVSSDKLDAMLTMFETIIYPRDVALFGDPPLTSGSSVKSSDRNSDGLVWLVLTPKVSDKKSAVGFFVATDFDDADANSNKADILYVDAAQIKDQDPSGILAHEFQHLLNFATKVYRAKANGGQGALEALWLDEGQAHFAEDACGFGGENVILLNQEVIPVFSESSLLRPIDPSDAKKELPMRGMAMTFVRYIFEQKGGVEYNSDGSITDKGGAALLTSLHTTEKQGPAAITATYGDFKDAFGRWITAFSLDGRGITTDSRLVFQNLIDDPVVKDTKNNPAKIGVKIRGTRLDNTGAEVKLEGPMEDDLTAANTQGTIPNATGKFYLLKDKSGKISISVSSKESDVRFAVIKLK